MLALVPSWLTADGLISFFGDWAMWGVALIIFIECGLLVGVVLPGDSLLFGVGMLIATDVINAPIWLACLVLTTAAITGNIVGYQVGKSLGPKLFTTKSRLFKLEYVTRTEAFFERYGNRAIVFARFVPVVRSVITALAGVGHMDRARYLKFTTIGGVIWGTGVTLTGFFLGSVQFIHDNLEVALVIIVIVSWIPLLLEGYRIKRDSAAR
jgi:membrane-associated protein